MKAILWETEVEGRSLPLRALLEAWPVAAYRAEFGSVWLAYRESRPGVRGRLAWMVGGCDLPEGWQWSPVRTGQNTSREVVAAQLRERCGPLPVLELPEEPAPSGPATYQGDLLGEAPRLVDGAVQRGLW